MEGASICPTNIESGFILVAFFDGEVFRYNLNVPNY